MTEKLLISLVIIPDPIFSSASAQRRKMSLTYWIIVKTETDTLAAYVHRPGHPEDLNSWRLSRRRFSRPPAVARLPYGQAMELQGDVSSVLSACAKILCTELLQEIP